jgi:hypothetical protein
MIGFAVVVEEGAPLRKMRWKIREGENRWLHKIIALLKSLALFMFIDVDSVTK